MPRYLLIDDIDQCYKKELANIGYVETIIAKTVSSSFIFDQRIKVRQDSQLIDLHFKAQQDCTLPSQKEQPHLHCMAAHCAACFTAV